MCKAEPENKHAVSDFSSASAHKEYAEEYLEQSELFRFKETIFSFVIEGDHNCPYELHFTIQAIPNYIEL